MRSDRHNSNSSSYCGAAVKILSIDAGYANFTDGGGAAGTFASGAVLPQGAFVLNSIIDVKSAYSGDTSCALQIGDGSDADRFNASRDPSIFAAAEVAGGAPQGVPVCDADTSITLTATGNSDWGAVASAGDMTVHILYIDTSISVSI